MVAILDFTQNAMANIDCGHTIMLGISENHNYGSYQSHESAYILARMISF